MSGNRIGAQKVAASRLGIAWEEYCARVDAGEKWCTACQDWHHRAVFGPDPARTSGVASRCYASRRSGSWLSSAERTALWETFRGCCVYCGAAATGVDHVIARSRGGLSEPGNLVPACGS